MHKVVAAPEKEHFHLSCSANPFKLWCIGCVEFAKQACCKHVLAVTHMIEQEKPEEERDVRLDLHKVMRVLALALDREQDAGEGDAKKQRRRRRRGGGKGGTKGVALCPAAGTHGKGKGKGKGKGVKGMGVSGKGKGVHGKAEGKGKGKLGAAGEAGGGKGGQANGKAPQTPYQRPPPVLGGQPAVKPLLPRMASGQQYVTPTHVTPPTKEGTGTGAAAAAWQPQEQQRPSKPSRPRPSSSTNPNKGRHKLQKTDLNKRSREKEQAKEQRERLSVYQTGEGTDAALVDFVLQMDVDAAILDKGDSGRPQASKPWTDLEQCEPLRAGQ